MVVKADTRDLTGPRWSSAVTCPRQAYYQAADAPTTLVSDTVEGYRRRGTVIGDAIRDELVSDYRREGRAPRREETIPWPARDPIGTGHADVYLPHERRIVEIKSRTDSTLDEAAVLQVAGYAINHPRAEHATIVSVDPSTFNERVYDVDVAGKADQVRAIEQLVVTAIRTDTPPERVCRHPMDGPAMFCEHVAHCFADWTPPEPDEVIGLDGDVAELAEAESDYSFAAAELKAAKERRDAKRLELRGLIPAGREYIVGDYRVKRTEVGDQLRFSLADALKAGHRLPDELEGFVTLSGAHDRWKVEPK